MKHNNITILILGILIFINLSVTENCNCNCQNNCDNQCDENSETTQCNNIDNGNDNGDDDKGKEENVKQNLTENYDDVDDANDNNNEDITNDNEESDNDDNPLDTNNIKRKRQTNGGGNRNENHIINMIPFHRVPVIMYNAFSQTLEPSRTVRQAQGAELTELAKGISKAIRTRHLSGFVGGLGLHAADVADNLMEISKDVITEHQRKTRSNDELKIWGKLADRIKSRSAGLLSIQDDENQEINIQLPFQNVGSTVRELVDLIPAKKTKRYYYKHYKPLANEIVKALNSTSFRSFLKNTYESDIFAISEDPIERSTNISFQKLRTKRKEDEEVNEEKI